ncbi:MAG: hypothetical protein ACRYE9_00150 [Janthinobacterium lividum]
MIARELLVKLGFNIDTTKFEQFKAMSDSVKAKMASVQKAANSPLSPDVKAAFQKLSSYNTELKSLSSQERKRVLELNRIEKQAISEVTQAQRQKHRELKVLEESAMQRQRRAREGLQNLIKSGQRIAKNVALVTGVASAGFALSLKNTLNDVKNFKTQKYHGEKTNSKFDKGQLKAVDEFNGALKDTKAIITEIRNSFVISLLPVITEVTKRFQGWLKANKELIKIKLISIVSNISEALKELISTTNSVVSMLGSWQRVLHVVKLGIAGLGIYKFSQSLYLVWQNLGLVKTALSAGLNFKSLFSPVTLISAALVGLFLVLEDFYVFSKGGKSVIGDIVSSDMWKTMEQNIKKVIAPLEKLKDLFESFKTDDEKDKVSKVPAFKRNSVEAKIARTAPYLQNSAEGKYHRQHLDDTDFENREKNRDKRTLWQGLKDIFSWSKPIDSAKASENLKPFEVNDRAYEPKFSGLERIESKLIVSLGALENLKSFEVNDRAYEPKFSGLQKIESKLIVSVGALENLKSFEVNDRAYEPKFSGLQKIESKLIASL